MPAVSRVDGSALVGSVVRPSVLVNVPGSMLDVSVLGSVVGSV